MTIEDQVRPGPPGWWDRFVGPRPTAIETAGTLGLLAAGALGGDAWLEPQAPTWRRVLMRFLAADLWGGVWVNNTRASARWYERPGQGARQHLGFAAQHAVHAGAIAYADAAGGRRDPWEAARWAVGHYGWMLGSAAAVAAAPRRARLAIAAAGTVGGVVLDRRLGPSQAAPWFAPVYYSKLLVGHAAGGVWAVKEDPSVP